YGTVVVEVVVVEVVVAAVVGVAAVVVVGTGVGGLAEPSGGDSPEHAAAASTSTTTTRARRTSLTSSWSTGRLATTRAGWPRGRRQRWVGCSAARRSIRVWYQSRSNPSAPARYRHSSARAISSSRWSCSPIHASRWRSVIPIRPGSNVAKTWSFGAL